MRGQEGQALVVAAIALVVLSLIASVNMVLWARQTAFATQRAHRQTALYAAEAGIAEGLDQLLKGNQAFLSGQPVTGQLGRGAYQVTLASREVGGQTTYVLESTGWSLGRPGERRTVRLAVGSAFFHPTVASRDLKVDNCFDFIITFYCAPVTFSPEAVYGRELNVSRRQQLTGVRQGAVPLPRLSYAAVASRVPNPANPIKMSGAECQMSVSGWYDIGSKPKCRSIHVTAPWVGITGDVDVSTLNVSQGSVLVVAGSVNVDQLRFVNGGSGTGDGIVVAGKGIELTSVDLVNWNSNSAMALYALDTNTPDCAPVLPGCTYDQRKPDAANDPSNDVHITEFSLVVRGPTSRTMSVFAAPYRVPPRDNPTPDIRLAIGGVVGTVGETSIEGSLVSAGDIELEGLGLLKAPWEITTDPRSLRPLFHLGGNVPGSGVLVLLGWTEEAGGGS